MPEFINVPNPAPGPDGAVFFSIDGNFGQITPPEPSGIKSANLDEMPTFIGYQSIATIGHSKKSGSGWELRVSPGHKSIAFNVEPLILPLTPEQVEKGVDFMPVYNLMIQQILRIASHTPQR